MAEKTDPSKGLSGEDASVQHGELLAEQVTKHARTSWLGLLGFLAFAGVTLLGVQDKDFFVSRVETELPLIGVSIPSNWFFWIAPILATALYLHLHLYLLKLWKIVFSLPDRIDGELLGARLWPWLVTDWALARRGDQGAPLPLRTIQWLLTVGLVWLAGPLVLFGFWWRSMVKHDLLLTSVLGLLLVLALYVGGTGWVFARKRPARVKETGTDLKRAAVFVLMALPVLWISVERTKLYLPPVDEDEFEAKYQMIYEDDLSAKYLTPWELWVHAVRIPLAVADLRNAQLSVKPADWLDRDIARLDFLKNYRERRGLRPGTELEGEEVDRFEFEWRRRREEYLSHIKAPVLKNADLRDAWMDGVFLAGTDLAHANLQSAALRYAQLEGAKLNSAHLEGVALFRAHLEGTNLSFAHMWGANLDDANLKRASLYRADLREVHLSGVDLSRADLNYANLQDVRDWQQIKSLSLANLWNVRNAPEGFFEWAIGEKGAVSVENQTEWIAMVKNEELYIAWKKKWDE